MVFFLPKSFDQNFGVNIVQHGWKVQYQSLWRQHEPPNTLGKGFWVINFSHRLRIIFDIGKCAFVFQEEVVGFFSGVISKQGFPEGEFQGGKIFKGTFAHGGFARIPIRNYFSLSYFLCAGSILHVEMLAVIVQGKLSLRLNRLEDLTVQRDADFQALFKKRS